ncbi:hypothetical protein I6N95_17330 [Vagococcus sp. BWB3-3]|uniref:DUF5057 domain-containing protein n=1 Tax=Vagococcus allomyrinae TaxID=2794353 RepID=A0A940PF11_9ENTE|nr:hypothetical protein [Vagococcus allomyrinae]MBP1042783.1 hypothetical protein [Vagococcus allomyrinae]
MNRGQNRRSYVAYLLFVLLIVLIGSGYLWGRQVKSGGAVRGATVEKNGDFRLAAENKWEPETKKNYAKLDWDAVSGLSNMGYQLYQSEDGENWSLRSLNYGKSIKVLNIYPNVSLLKGWIESVSNDSPEIMKDQNGNNLISVDEVSYASYNANPNAYLKDSSGNYQYDVLMFGTWDSNNMKDLTSLAIAETEKFVQSGRGTLWGHDTLAGRNPNQVKAFGPYLGLGYQQVHPGTVQNGEPLASVWTGSTEVNIKDNGYLMKYPFELANSAKFTIPYAHTIELQQVDMGTVWLEFGQPTGSWPNPITNFVGKDNKTYRNGWYLKTNGNVGMIQTGHSNGASTLDERKIIANTLYNLAQVSLDNFANDQTVRDDQAPTKPESPVIRCGKDGQLNVKVKAIDRGKDYQWYVEANTKNQGVKRSDTVKETIVSNIAGYFYDVSDSPTSSLGSTVEGYKDAYGRIAKEKFDSYVAPDDDALNYETETSFTIDASRKSGQYIHILAVDRSNNVSEVSSHLIKELQQYVDFEVERTKDEAKLINVVLDDSLNKKMKSLEIQIPKNTVIKNFTSLSLPTGWYSFENSETEKSRSFTFAMEGNNQLATIYDFLSTLRVTMTDNVNQQGSIRLVFHEKVYTSWTDPAGGSHYYTFVNETISWSKAYNESKKLSYKGLQGYLATVTSSEEHDFIFDNIAKMPGWLGGTRLSKTSAANSLIMDEKQIPETLYDSGKGYWYWASGPEAGLMYLTKPTYDGGGRAPLGVHDGWVRKSNSGTAVANEPNNSGNAENAMIFAFKNKWFNDIPYTHVGGSNAGYYVEFSEYGSQKEQQELTDVCWEADIPQKVSLTIHDEEGNQLGKVIMDQGLRIDQQQTVAIPEIDLHDFIKLINLDGTEHLLTYDITNTYQEGQLIYGNRKVVVHIRQIINEPDESLVIPQKGFGALISRNHGKEGQVFNLEMTSSNTNLGGFDTYIIKYQSDYPLVDFKAIVPMNYRLVGYVVTQTDGGHEVSASVSPFESIDVSNSSEFWLSIYLQPISRDEVSLYHWEYKNNQLGEIELP